MLQTMTEPQPKRRRRALARTARGTLQLVLTYWPNHRETPPLFMAASNLHARAIQERADFGSIRYANCWEDADILCEALEPAPGKRILSIASAGDNSLALLAEGADVTAVDLSPAQLACLELRVAAIGQLEHDDVLAFLGIRSEEDRRRTYGKIAPSLSRKARCFWDARPTLIESGIIHAGKFENYFHKFRTRVLPWIHGRGMAEGLLDEKDEAGRRDYYDNRWNNVRWRLLFRLFFNRFVMGRFGRDPEFFRYVKGSVAQRILRRAEHALTVLPTHANPYLRYIITGNFGEALPRYLRREHFDRLRAQLDRLTLFEGPVEQAAAKLGPLDGFNLSDVFEYVDPKTSAGMYRKLLDAARPGARLAYWNMLVPRRRPAELAGRVRSLEGLSADLFARDLAFFYGDFVVEEVL